MKKSRIIFLALAAFSLRPAFSEPPPEPFQGAGMIGTPKIHFEVPNHNFGSIVQGNDIKHKFSFQNVGTGDLIITKAKGSCGCTVTTVSSMPYKPGEQGVIDVSVDTRGKFGRVFKDVRVESNDPASPVMLALEGMVMENSAHPPMAAGEALFKGSCAECHSTPAKGKSGKELYQAVCAICHDPKPGDSSHKTMALNQEQLAQMDSGSLKEIISKGMPDTSMPGFLKKHNGPLSKKQVKSLVEYLESLRQK